MKKSLVLALLLISILALSSVALAENRQVISIKVGFNSFSAEWESISAGGNSFFIQEAAYGYMSTTLVGIRRHTAVQGPHTYLGGALGIYGWWPTVDAHIGYEFHPSFLPPILNARVEGGASLISDWNFHLYPILHAGVGVSFDFDLKKFF